MKVLYVASNPDAGTTLRLEQEITELRRNALATSGEPVEFVFLPSLPFEDLPSQISKHKPDIVREGDFWEARGDFRLFACGITAGGDHYSVGGQLCTALETYYELHSSDATPTVVTAIARLRSMDGTAGSDRPPIVPGKARLTTVSRRGMSRPPSDPKIKPHAKGRQN